MIWLIFYLFCNSVFNPDIIDILSTPENATQSKTSVSQTEISEENIHHEQPSVFNPFQKEIFTYLVEGFKVSIVSKFIKWRMFIHTKGVQVSFVCIMFSKSYFYSHKVFWNSDNLNFNNGEIYLAWFTLFKRTHFVQHWFLSLSSESHFLILCFK